MLKAQWPTACLSDQDLKDSLKRDGMFNPVVCKYDSAEREDIWITRGCRRWAFWKALGKTTLDAVVVSYDLGKEFPCEELELTSGAVEAKFAPGFGQITLGVKGLNIVLSSTEFT